MRAIWRDPAAPSLALFALLVVVGFAAVVGGWRVAAGTAFVPEQVAALLSGGLGGLALVLIGSILAVVQVGRRLAAAEAQATDAVLDEAEQVLAVLAEETTP